MVARPGLRDDPSGGGQQRGGSAGALITCEVVVYLLEISEEETTKTGDSTKVTHFWEFLEVVGEMKNEKTKAFLLVSSCRHGGSRFR